MKITSYVFYFFLCASTIHGEFNAVINVPIADVLGDSFKPIKKISEIESGYKKLPLCGQRISDCPRVHQLLMNEVLEVLKVENKQCLVRVPSLFYEIEGSKEKRNTFWILKENISTFKELSAYGITSAYFPDPITYNASHKKISHKKIVTLIKPFYEQTTKQRFSVGTRFVVHETQQNAYLIYFFNAKNKRIEKLALPKASCICDLNNESFEKKINLCIQIARSWIASKKIIPYVWGGCSFTTYCTDSLIEKNESDYGPCYERIGCKNQIPKVGFDCTGLLLRLMQLCELPFYFKNSTTIVKHLELLPKHVKIHQGDLIWIPGHIMIVADLNRNTLLEARGYNHGFGKVQEIPLNKVFKDVQTFSQLKLLFHDHKPLQRLDNQGTVAHDIADFKLLMIKSILNKEI